MAIYLPMILELPIAMLACARIGAVHSVIFAGYGANALATRVSQAKACLIVTCDVYFRGSKMISSKAIVNQALDMFSPQVKLRKSFLVCLLFAVFCLLFPLPLVHI